MWWSGGQVCHGRGDGGSGGGVCDLHPGDPGGLIYDDGGALRPRKQNLRVWHKGCNVRWRWWWLWWWWWCWLLAFLAGGGAVVGGVH